MVQRGAARADLRQDPHPDIAHLAERDRQRGPFGRIHGDHEVTTLDTHAPPAIAPDGPRPTKRRRSREGGLSAPLFVSGYVVLLLAFGVLPTLYAVYLAFTNVRGHFTGVNQFVRVFQD